MDRPITNQENLMWDKSVQRGQYTTPHLVLLPCVREIWVNTKLSEKSESIQVYSTLLILIISSYYIGLHKPFHIKVLQLSLRTSPRGTIVWIINLISDVTQACASISKCNGRRESRAHFLTTRIGYVFFLTFHFYLQFLLRNGFICHKSRGFYSDLWLTLNSGPFLTLIYLVKPSDSHITACGWLHYYRVPECHLCTLHDMGEYTQCGSLTPIGPSYLPSITMVLYLKVLHVLWLF